MSKSIALQAVTKQLNMAKAKISEKVDREADLKEGKQVLYLGDRAMKVALLNDPNGTILRRIRSEQPEAAGNLSDSAIMSLVLDALKRYFKSKYPRAETVERDNQIYVEWSLNSPHVFVVFNSISAMQKGIRQAREVLSTKTSRGGRLASSFLGVGQSSAAKGILPEDTMHFSHLRGPGVRRNEAARDMVQQGILSGLSSGLSLYRIKQLGKVKREITKVIELDAEVELDKWATKRAIGFTGDITLHVGIIETGTANQASGGRSGKEIEKLLPVIDKVLEDIARQIDFVTMSTSKSLIEQYDDVIQDVFFDRSVRSSKTKRKVQAKTKFKKKSGSTRTEHYIQPLSTSNKSSSQVNYIDIQRQINAHLYDTLKHDVMAKGGASERLNYRSGRFAGSVQVSNIIPPTQGLRTHTINVRYMYNPYMVFAPGGRLYKPLRNPETLAGQAIRKIIKDQAIQELGAINVRAG